MILIVCVDERNGMMFNNRRQSKDKVLIAHILEKTKNHKLWITNFSKDIFNSDDANNVIIDDYFIEKIGKEDYCFIENTDVKTLINKVDKIIVYNWNRHYPADQYLDINFDEWVVNSEVEFSGYSHEKITEKTYIRGIK